MGSEKFMGCSVCDAIHFSFALNLHNRSSKMWVPVY
jgi:hypothetical protein